MGLLSFLGIGKKSPAPILLDPKGKRRPKLDIVGESHYQPALWRITGKSTGDEGPEWRGRAVLIAEPSNAYDRNAVRVAVNGQTVGHLDRDDAKDIQPLLIATGPVSVPCFVKGGYKLDRGGRASIGLVLEMAPADLAVLAKPATD